MWDNDAVLECVENYAEQTKEGGGEKAEAEDDGDESEDEKEEEEENVDVARDATVSDLDYLKSKTVKEKVQVASPRFVHFTWMFYFRTRNPKRSPRTRPTSPSSCPGCPTRSRRRTSSCSSSR